LRRHSPAEKAPTTADPGEEIKEGAIKFGHGVRDGAVRAWSAVKSAVGSTAGKQHASPPAKDAPKEAK
jgi:hypothetical protein